MIAGMLSVRGMLRRSMGTYRAIGTPKTAVSIVTALMTLLIATPEPSSGVDFDAA